MDVGKREDRLLEKISELVGRRNETEALILFYWSGGFIAKDIAEHLSRVLLGQEEPVPAGEGVAT